MRFSNVCNAAAEGRRVDYRFFENFGVDLRGFGRSKRIKLHHEWTLNLILAEKQLENKENPLFRPKNDPKNR